MIQVLTTQGWHDYCDVGVETDLRDVNGDVLYTGDVVEVVSHQWGADLATPVGVHMVIFDQHQNFISTDRFFVSGWLSQDWNDGQYVLRRVDRDQLPADSHHRIVEE